MSLLETILGGPTPRSRPNVPITMYGIDSPTAATPIHAADWVDSYTTHITASPYNRSPSTLSAADAHSTSTERFRSSCR